MSDEIKDKIAQNAELVITIVRDEMNVNLNFDEPSVQWIDVYIERLRSTLSREGAEQLVNLLGSFLGECIRRNFGGEWTLINGQWAIAFDEKNAAFPFNKVSKQIQFGSGDSVHSFYRTIPAVFKLNKPPDHQ